MIAYFECLLFFIISIVVMFLLGSVIQKKYEDFSTRFICGFIAHEFLVAIVGIPIQLLKLPYILFFIYVILLDIGIVVFSIYKIKSSKIKLFPNGIKEEIKNNWVIILILSFLMLMSFAYIDNYWSGNFQDDGYYLTKVATLPHIKDPFITNPATGFKDFKELSYLINTWEMESSVYTSILHVDASIFLRLFLSAFQYFLYLNVILSLLYRIYEAKKFKFNKMLLQLPLIIVILFSFSMKFLPNYNLLSVQDSWQFNSAMYYGSSIARTMGIFLLLLPFISKSNIKFKDILIYGIISFVLISKSTIAIPLILLVGISYLIAHYVIEGNKKQRIFSLLLIILMLIVSAFLHNNKALDKHIINVFVWHLKSIPFIIGIIGIILSLFYKSKIINKINLTLILIIIMMILDPINNIFSTSSVYLFVGARMQTTIIYSVIILGFSYISFFIFNVIKKPIYIFIIYIVLVFGLFAVSIQSFRQTYGSIRDAYRVLYANKHFMPNSTIKLGNKLEQLKKEKKCAINVISPAWRKIDNHEHALPVLLRVYAPHINVVSAVGRYKTTTKFSKYKKDGFDAYEKFTCEPNYKNYIRFKKVLDEVPINCMVVNDISRSEKYIRKLGFSKYGAVEDKKTLVKYHIYYRNNK